MSNEAPSNIEAEQALLGAILVNSEAYHRVAPFFHARYFYEPVHATIYEAIEKFTRVGKVANVLTVKTMLPDDFTPDMTMQQYLARLAANATTIINAIDYAAVLKDLADRRSLMSIGTDMIEVARQSDSEETVQDQIEDAERSLFEVAKTSETGKGAKDFRHFVAKSIDMVSAAFKRDGALSGLATGLGDLDRLMGGLQPSDLVVVAGRPGMGKTALATNIAYHIASHFKQVIEADQTNTVDGGRVAFFSLEMSGEQLATRIISEQARISSSSLRRGDIHESQFGVLVDVANRMNNCPLRIDDTGGVSIAQLVSSARRMSRSAALDLIVVDYMQLLSGSRRKSEQGRVQEVTEITTSLKALAKDLNVPVIALSQLSRQVENRENKRPQLSDLRESGSIEQDADVVLFVYREDYYLEREEPKEGTAEHLEWMGEMEAAHGKAEIIVAKQRHGPTGTVNVAFDRQFTRFSNLARADYMPEKRA